MSCTLDATSELSESQNNFPCNYLYSDVPYQAKYRNKSAKTSTQGGCARVLVLSETNVSNLIGGFA